MAGRAGTSHSTEATLVRARGAIEAALAICGVEFTVVQPQVWKRFYGLKKRKPEPGEPKDVAKLDALNMARKLYPNLQTDELRLVAHHNRADAVLITHYAARHAGEF
jgi:hypothetical protein